MAKVLCYMPLHYGAEYLDAAIKSVHSFVDKIMILYTATPSYGFGTEVRCPESREELKEIAENASNKVVWKDCSFGNEGEHRRHIYKFSKGYDLVLAIDADEVFDQEDLPIALDQALNSNYRYLGVNGFVNFWRSFDYACYDGFRPVRITNLKNREGQGEVFCKVYHFSCAQKEEIMRYKYDIHGHKDEIRTDWLDDIFYKWEPDNNFGNLHPVANDIWNTVPFDKQELPAILKSHKNFNKRLI